MLGSLTLPLPRGFFTVYGGPYKQVPEHMLGVKMAEEIDHPYDVSIPTPDFQTPPKAALDEGLKVVVDAICLGIPVYVGCMAGRGRTGLMLAILAKVWGVNDPVKYVRAMYYPHAVETADQFEFVQGYEPPLYVRGRVLWTKMKSVFSPKYTASVAKPS